MTKPTISLQELRAKIGHRAKSAPAHRFWGLHVHLTKLETLEVAYQEVRIPDGLERPFRRDLSADSGNT
jgi:RNA-directed DNA polymerase